MFSVQIQNALPTCLIIGLWNLLVIWRLYLGVYHHTLMGMTTHL